MNNNYNYPPQQNYQTYQAYSNYDNSYASQYPNYDYYYQQPNHQQQYYQPAIDPHTGQPSTYHIDQAASYAGHAPPLQETYDQNSLAQWNNYYAQYYPQHYQRPPPVKPNKPLNPAADTRPMSKFCCNRVLKTVQAITQHESLHIKCPHCDFMCLKSYLEEHEEQYHGKPKSKKPSRPDGIAPPNAPKLDTPEKLAAWIAERKKNWPTPANIERRTREEAEQMARGELPLKRKGNIQHNQDKRQRIENNSVENKDDDDDVMDPERDAVSSKDPSSMGKILLPEDRPKRRCMYFMKGKCTKGSECNFLHEKPPGPKVVSTIRKRPNLLYKLLEKEIMQEKSVILQCFRYIVDNNFFGKGEKANSQKSDTRDV